MNNRLEQYVEEVGHNLRSLPEERRQEEIAEIRSHLDARVEAEMELGKTQDEAVAEALHQFGSSRKVGSGLRRAWRRRTESHQAALVGAVISTVILCVLNLRLNAWWMGEPGRIVAGVDIAMVVCWCLFGLIGLMVGGTTRSSRGVLLGAVAFVGGLISFINPFQFNDAVATRQMVQMILIMAVSGWVGEQLGQFVRGAPISRLAVADRAVPLSGRLVDGAGVHTAETEREEARPVGKVIEVTFRIRIR